jgi:hypothetical protein
MSQQWHVEAASCRFSPVPKRLEAASASKIVFARLPRAGANKVTSVRMHIPTLSLTIALILIVKVSLYANGGASLEGVPRTGSVSASDKGRKTDIAIESENLKIDLQAETATVEVRYVMHNTGGKVQQDFFFPVERWGSLPGEETAAPAGLDHYQIMADGKELKSTEVPGPKDPVETITVPMWDEKVSIIKSWKKSVIPFEKDQKRDITIRYSSRYAFTDESVSDDDHPGEQTFAYSLSPAATWKGPIGKGKIEINVLHPEPEDVSIDKPKDRFKKISDTHYEWEFENLKPSLADDIKIIAHLAYDKYPTGYSEEALDRHDFYILRGHQYFLDHTDYNATASSTLAPQGDRNYDVVNIKGDPRREIASPWAEGVEGDGIGESITLEVKRPLPLYGLLIRPGYFDYDREETWTKNNRVSELEITLNDEHTFIAKIPDERAREPSLVRIRGYTKPVTKVKLVIKGVYRGTKDRDTCISLVQLRAVLAQKPEVTPAR